MEDAYHSFPGPSNPPLLPPLHPSPAVLLHIKYFTVSFTCSPLPRLTCRYVMESVCEAMFITDVTIVTATDTLRAHRSILSAHSPFLAFLLGEQASIQYILDIYPFYSLLVDQESLEEDPVLLFPNHSSFVVRYLKFSANILEVL